MEYTKISKLALDKFPLLKEIRRQFHQYPELSFNEFETSKFIREQLTSYGIDFNILTPTGTVALIGKGDTCVALRADIDALPITEDTNLDFASKNLGVMHACGHDFHAAMLLVTAKILKENENKLNGCVKLIFQPGEEKIPGGASLMIEQGVLENPRPDVIFAQHIYPSEKSGTISISEGPILASADELYWTINGTGSHAAQPHIGRDAILASAQLINYYQSVLTKFKNPLDAGVLSVTSIHGGSATNIFPDEVKMMGTLRSFNDDWRNYVHELLIENTHKIVSLYGCTCEFEIRKGYPPVVNDSKATEYARKTAQELFGDKLTLKFEPKMWAEDFAYYAQQIPACFWLLGVIPQGSDSLPPLHNAKLSPDENAMTNGVTMLLASTFNYLNSRF